MARQTNASNQNYGGGSSDYAVIAPYIESPSPFERMGGRQRASGRSSSGKNPFEDFLDITFEDPKISGMYAGESYDIASKYTEINLMEKLLKNSVMSAITTADEEQAPKIAIDYFHQMGELNTMKRTLDAQKEERQAIFSGNKALVQDNNNKPYYDSRGRPMVQEYKDKDGKVKYGVLTYGDLHAINARQPLGATSRLDAPPDETLFPKLARNYAKDISITDEDAKEIEYRYNSQDLTFWRTTTAAKSRLMQEESNMGYQLKTDISTNPELDRSLRATYSRTLEGKDLVGMSDEDFSKGYQAWIDKFVDATVKSSIQEKSLGSRTDEQIGALEYTQKFYNSNLANFSSLDDGFTLQVSGANPLEAVSQNQRVTINNMVSASTENTVIQELFPAKTSIATFPIGTNNANKFNSSIKATVGMGGNINQIKPSNSTTVYIKNPSGDGFIPTPMNATLENIEVSALNVGDAFYAPEPYIIKKDDVETPTTDRGAYLTYLASNEFDNPTSLSSKQSKYALQKRNEYISKELQPIIDKTFDNIGDIDYEIKDNGQLVANLSTTVNNNEYKVSINVGDTGIDIKINGIDLNDFTDTSYISGSFKNKNVTLKIAEETRELRQKLSSWTGIRSKFNQSIENAKKAYINDFIKEDGGISTTFDELKLASGKMDKAPMPEWRWYLPFTVRLQDDKDKPYEILNFNKGKVSSTIYRGKDIGKEERISAKETILTTTMYMPVNEQRMYDIVGDDAVNFIKHFQAKGRASQSEAQNLIIQKMSSFNQ